MNGYILQALKGQCLSSVFSPDEKQEEEERKKEKLHPLFYTKTTEYRILLHLSPFTHNGEPRSMDISL